MKHEFKVTRSKDQTVYTLESASSGGTSSGSVASVSTALGGVQRRPTDSIFAQEAKKEEPKPRNFVAKNAKMSGAGKMKDKSKTIPRHEKHKKPVAEGVAGPEKCWPGHRKVGTQPGTGKNAGKRVNDCEKIKEQGVAEDHEIQMASSELQSIAKNAEHLLDLVRKYSEQEGLQAWQQSKITKAADYLNSVLQSVSGEQSGMEEARNNYHANTTGFSRGNRDDERHDLDMPEQDPGETMMWNLTIDGKPLNPKPIMGRSNLIKFGKQQAASGVDLSNAVISPAGNMDEDDSALQAFLAKGGKIQVGKTHPPRKAEKWQGSSHIGGAGGKGTKGSVSGLGANTKTGNKPVVSVEEDAYMMELAGKLAEKIPPNADVDYYINDFSKSTAPQFKGKNPAKRKQMAIAAYYGSKQKKK